jgi:hypothetical protein
MLQPLILAFTLVSMEGQVPVAPKYYTAEVQAIADKCGVKRSKLRWDREGYVHFNAPETTTWDQAHCVFSELKTRNIPTVQGIISDGS